VKSGEAHGLFPVRLQRVKWMKRVDSRTQRAYRMLFRSKMNVTQAIERAQTGFELAEVKDSPVYRGISERGVVI
jgi:acyl-[acyl carrier protein]--UDP-N-acetylglucosamine O-acyltransferase